MEKVYDYTIYIFFKSLHIHIQMTVFIYYALYCIWKSDQEQLFPNVFHLQPIQPDWEKAINNWQNGCVQK